MNKCIDGANILITGGTGSLGTALASKILSGAYGSPERVLIFSRDEAKQHDMRTSFLHKANATEDLIFEDYTQRLRFRIGDVRSIPDLSRALDGIDIVVNAAALKQVPSCEYFPEQAIQTNCLGTVNLIEAIRTTPNRVKAVVGLSTDKACEPTNVMGMTKALQERLLIAANGIISDTRFVTVRYGNIIASRGSAIPLFLEQIRLKKPVTLTADEMTRFLMPVDHAVETIFKALTEAMPGEIVVCAAPAVLIRNVALALMEDDEVPIRITGIRPGEKLHETLVTNEEASRAIRVGEFIFVSPMLPEFSKRPVVGAEEKLQGAVCSNLNVMDFAGTVELLSRWGILQSRELAMS